MKSLSNVLDGKRTADKEATDSKPDVADGTNNENWGERNVESVARRKNETLSNYVEKETAPVGSKVGN